MFDFTRLFKQIFYLGQMAFVQHVSVLLLFIFSFVFVFIRCTWCQVIGSSFLFFSFLFGCMCNVLAFLIYLYFESWLCVLADWCVKQSATRLNNNDNNSNLLALNMVLVFGLTLALFLSFFFSSVTATNCMYVIINRINEHLSIKE